jgi:hypothetical protein
MKLSTNSVAALTSIGSALGGPLEAHIDKDRGSVAKAPKCNREHLLRSMVDERYS